MKKIINLTPHEVTILDGDDVAAVIPPSGQVARVATTREPAGTVAGVPAYRVELGEVVGLPEPYEDRVYLVSAIVKAAVPGRWDVVSPGELVRGPDGQPIGCRGVTV